MEELYGINLFEFEEIKTIEPGSCQFNVVAWCFESMKEYDGLNVQRFSNGLIVILEDNVLIKSLYAFQIPEFLVELEKKYGLQEKIADLMVF